VSNNFFVQTDVIT